MPLGPGRDGPFDHEKLIDCMSRTVHHELGSIRSISHRLDGPRNNALKNRSGI